MTSATFSQASETQKVAVDHKLVEEVCEHLLKEKLRDLKADHIAPEARETYRKAIVPPVYFNDIGHKRLAVTKEDFERMLRPWKRELGRLMLQYPRNDVHDTAAAYFTYLRRTVGDMDGWFSRFNRMQLYLAHIHRIEEEERAEREREAQRRRDEERAKREAEKRERAELERQASPDEAEIKRLLAVIAEAKVIEALLALHNKAKDARRALRAMYETEREACEALGRPVPERSVPEAAGTFDDNDIALVIAMLRGEEEQRSQPAAHSRSSLRVGRN